MDTDNKTTEVHIENCPNGSYMFSCPCCGCEFVHAGWVEVICPECGTSLHQYEYYKEVV